MEQSETIKRTRQPRILKFYIDINKRKEYLFRVAKRREHSDKKCSCTGNRIAENFTCTYSILMQCDWLSKEGIEHEFYI